MRVTAFVIIFYVLQYVTADFIDDFNQKEIKSASVDFKDSKEFITWGSDGKEYRELVNETTYHLNKKNPKHHGEKKITTIVVEEDENGDEVVYEKEIVIEELGNASASSSSASSSSAESASAGGSTDDKRNIINRSESRNARLPSSSSASSRAVSSAGIAGPSRGVIVTDNGGASSSSTASSSSSSAAGSNVLPGPYGLGGLENSYELDQSSQSDEGYVGQGIGNVAGTAAAAAATAAAAAEGPVRRKDYGNYRLHGFGAGSEALSFADSSASNKLLKNGYGGLNDVIIRSPGGRSSSSASSRAVSSAGIAGPSRGVIVTDNGGASSSSTASSSSSSAAGSNVLPGPYGLGGLENSYELDQSSQSDEGYVGQGIGNVAGTAAAAAATAAAAAEGPVRRKDYGNYRLHGFGAGSEALSFADSSASNELLKNGYGGLNDVIIRSPGGRSSSSASSRAVSSAGIAGPSRGVIVTDNGGASSSSTASSSSSSAAGSNVLPAPYGLGGLENSYELDQSSQSDEGYVGQGIGNVAGTAAAAAATAAAAAEGPVRRKDYGNYRLHRFGAGSEALSFADSSASNELLKNGYGGLNDVIIRSPGGRSSSSASSRAVSSAGIAGPSRGVIVTDNGGASSSSTASSSSSSAAGSNVLPGHYELGGLENSYELDQSSHSDEGYVGQGIGNVAGTAAAAAATAAAAAEGPVRRKDYGNYRLHGFGAGSEALSFADSSASNELLKNGYGGLNDVIIRSPGGRSSSSASSRAVSSAGIAGPSRGVIVTDNGGASSSSTASSSSSSAAGSNVLPGHYELGGLENSYELDQSSHSDEGYVGQGIGNVAGTAAAAAATAAAAAEGPVRRKDYGNYRLHGFGAGSEALSFADSSASNELLKNGYGGLNDVIIRSPGGRSSSSASSRAVSSAGIAGPSRGVIVTDNGGASSSSTASSSSSSAAGSNVLPGPYGLGGLENSYELDQSSQSDEGYVGQDIGNVAGTAAAAAATAAAAAEGPVRRKDYGNYRLHGFGAGSEALSFADSNASNKLLKNGYGGLNDVIIRSPGGRSSSSASSRAVSSAGIAGPSRGVIVTDNGGASSSSTASSSSSSAAGSNVLPGHYELGGLENSYELDQSSHSDEGYVGQGIGNVAGTAAAAAATAAAAAEGPVRRKDYGNYRLHGFVAGSEALSFADSNASNKLLKNGYGGLNDVIIRSPGGRSSSSASSRAVSSAGIAGPSRGVIVTDNGGASSSSTASSSSSSAAGSNVLPAPYGLGGLENSYELDQSSQSDEGYVGQGIGNVAGTAAAAAATAAAAAEGPVRRKDYGNYRLHGFGAGSEALSFADSSASNELLKNGYGGLNDVIIRSPGGRSSSSASSRAVSSAGIAGPSRGVIVTDNGGASSSSTASSSSSSAAGSNVLPGPYGLGGLENSYELDQSSQSDEGYVGQGIGNVAGTAAAAAATAAAAAEGPVRRKDYGNYRLHGFGAGSEALSFADSSASNELLKNGYGGLNDVIIRSPGGRSSSSASSRAVSSAGIAGPSRGVIVTDNGGASSSSTASSSSSSAAGSNVLPGPYGLGGLENSYELDQSSHSDEGYVGQGIGNVAGTAAAAAATAAAAAEGPVRRKDYGNYRLHGFGAGSEALSFADSSASNELLKNGYGGLNDVIIRSPGGRSSSSASSRAVSSAGIAGPSRGVIVTDNGGASSSSTASSSSSSAAGSNVLPGPYGLGGLENSYELDQSSQSDEGYIGQGIGNVAGTAAAAAATAAAAAEGPVRRKDYGNYRLHGFGAGSEALSFADSSASNELLKNGYGGLNDVIIRSPGGRSSSSASSRAVSSAGIAGPSRGVIVTDNGGASSSSTASSSSSSAAGSNVLPAPYGLGGLENSYELDQSSQSDEGYVGQGIGNVAGTAAAAAATAAAAAEGPVRRKDYGNYRLHGFGAGSEALSFADSSASNELLKNGYGGLNDVIIRSPGGRSSSSASSRAVSSAGIAGPSRGVIVTDNGGASSSSTASSSSSSAAGSNVLPAPYGLGGLENSYELDQSSQSDEGYVGQGIGNVAGTAAAAAATAAAAAEGPVRRKDYGNYRLHGFGAGSEALSFADSNASNKLLKNGYGGLNDVIIRSPGGRSSSSASSRAVSSAGIAGPSRGVIVTDNGGASSSSTASSSSSSAAGSNVLPGPYGLGGLENSYELDQSSQSDEGYIGQGIGNVAGTAAAAAATAAAAAEGPVRRKDYVNYILHGFGAGSEALSFADSSASNELLKNGYGGLNDVIIRSPSGRSSSSASSRAVSSAGIAGPSRGVIVTDNGGASSSSTASSSSSSAAGSNVLPGPYGLGGLENSYELDQSSQSDEGYVGQGIGNVAGTAAAAAATAAAAAEGPARRKDYGNYRLHGFGAGSEALSFADSSASNELLKNGYGGLNDVIIRSPGGRSSSSASSRAVSSAGIAGLSRGVIVTDNGGASSSSTASSSSSNAAGSNVLPGPYGLGGLGNSYKLDQSSQSDEGYVGQGIGNVAGTAAAAAATAAAAAEGPVRQNGYESYELRGIGDDTETSSSSSVSLVKSLRRGRRPKVCPLRENLVVRIKDVCTNC